MERQMIRMDIIFNPVAGQRRAARYLPQLISLLGQSTNTIWGKAIIFWHKTTKPGDASRLALNAADQGSSILVAAGGDGTVNEVINGLMLAKCKPEQRPVLAVLPLGSANDFAAALGITCVKGGVARLRNGRVCQVDIGQIQSSTMKAIYFGFSGGVGFVAAVALCKNKLRYFRGSGLYFVAALQSLIENRQAIGMQICFDDGDIVEQQILLLSVNNTPSVGGFPLTPGAMMNDGIFDVLYVDGAKLPRMLRLLVEAKRGKHLQFPEFHLKRARHLIVRTSSPLSVHVDGQIYCQQTDHVDKIEINMHEAALNVVS